jgi:UDP-N-acetylmuramoyl-L-alanyl-D-glutamate--2,6-diaminopimelate ligase
MDTKTVTLSSLSTLLDHEGMLVAPLSTDPDSPEMKAPVTGVSFDSRQVGPGDLFCCKGVRFDPSFLSSALESGAVGYLCDEERAHDLAVGFPGVPVIVTDAIRYAMSLVAAETYHHPDRDLTVVGVTGTKGKTTVAYMLRSILDAGAPRTRTAIMSSVNIFDGVDSFKGANTTPESPEVFRHLAVARDHDLTNMVMEISSQGFKYDRVWGLPFDVGVFLNISRDHVSPIEHPTFEDYLASKLRIFERCRVGVVNMDTDHLDEVMAAASRCESILTFSTTNPEADVWASDAVSSIGHITFVAHTPTWTGEVTLNMSGYFNVFNATAAIAACEVLHVDRERILAGLETCSVPGRMELVYSKDRTVTAVVDFAHNALSFRCFFTSIKQDFPGYRVIAVFGSPGNKALERRQQLPEAASPFCDHIIYCEDDPAREDPAGIIAEMVEATPADQSYEVVIDRGQAIRTAVMEAHEADAPTIVALLAKGDEARMLRGGGAVPFPTDMELLHDALHELDGE